MTKPEFYECSDNVIPCALILLPLLELSEQYGIAPRKVLKGSNLVYHDLIKSDLNISYNQLETCCQNILNLMPYNDFSFQIGQQFFNQYNLNIKTVLANARNLNHVIKLLVCFGSNFFPLCKFTQFTTEDHHHFAIDVGIKYSSERLELFFYEILLSIVSSFLDWRYRDVDMVIQLPFKQPEHIEQYHTFIKYPVTFNKPLMLISVNKHHFSTVNSEISTIVRRHAFYKLCKTTKKHSLLSTLTHFILRHPNTTLETAAAYLSLSPATLKRKLQTHNTSFKYEKDQVLKNVTLFHLMQTSASNQAISNKLAINDLTNFRRLLKRLTGKTPNQLRLAK